MRLRGGFFYILKVIRFIHIDRILNPEHHSRRIVDYVSGASIDLAWKMSVVL